MSAADPSPRPAPARRTRVPDGPGTAVLAVGRSTLIASGIGFAAVTAWAAGATWYVLFRDDVAARHLERHAEMQFAYEARISALRSRLDRIASQKLIEQDQLEGRMAKLVDRQLQLESRQAALAALAERTAAPAAPASPGVAGASMRPPPAADLPAAASSYASPKPSPEPELFRLRMREAPPPERRASPRPRPRDLSALPAPARLAAVEQSMDAMELMQMQAVGGLLSGTRAHVSRLRAAIIQVGLDPDGLEATPHGGGLGGPMVPLGAVAKAGRFEALVANIAVELAALDRLRRSTEALPFDRPVPGDADPTSGFGVRLDPFTRRPAMHTGLDLRAEHGEPVQAAGAGRVVSAEYAGGYGNMVEIDHGNGVTTRYAHLSSFGVAPGQMVASGTIVGRVGSTGRSTGPHLHYETRIAGEPVDPQRFLAAGAGLAGATTAVASR